MLLACLKKTVVLVWPTQLADFTKTAYLLCHFSLLTLQRQLAGFYNRLAYLLCKDSLLAFTTDFLDCPFLLFKILFRIPGICSYR